MKTKKRVPYKKFKEDMNKLIKYALAHEFDLGRWVSTNGIKPEDVLKAKTPCGAPACILGYAPVVFPRRFTYEAGSSFFDDAIFICIPASVD